MKNLSNAKLNNWGFIWISFMIMLLLTLSWVDWGTITGSISSFTPTTIQTNSTYTFKLTNSRNLTSGEYFSIVFPSDFDFSSEATSTVTKTWTPGSGMDATSGISSWSLAKSTRTLTVTLGNSTTSKTITFSVTPIKNALYAKTTSSIVITSYTSANVAIDSSSSGFTTTPTSGALNVAFTSETGTVGTTETLKFTLTLTNTIGTDGKIHIFLPKWDPDNPSPNSIFPDGTVSWSSITNVSLIYWNLTTNVDGSNTQDKILVTGYFTSGATTIEFSILNYHNPPSLAPLTTIQVYTTTSTETEKLDEDDSTSLTMTTPASLPSSNVDITISDAEINGLATYTFNVTVTNPLPIGSQLEITFPSEVTPASSKVSVIGTEGINTLITTNYDSSTKILTLYDIVPNSTYYVSSGDSIAFQILNITNPSTTETTSSFSITTFETVDYEIESVSSGVTVTASPGDIQTFTVVPINTKIRESTIYRFTFTSKNTIPVGSSLEITFPSDIVVTDASSYSCINTSTSIVSSSTVWNAVSNVITISGGFTSEISSGTSITFSIKDLIENADTTQTTGYFQATFYDSSSNAIDTYSGTDVTLTFVENSLQSLVATPSSQYTGVETTYNINILASTDKIILKDSYVSIVFPPSITISDETSSASSWAKVSGYPSAISWSYNDTNSLIVSNGFSSSYAGGNLIFTISGIRNPRSTSTTLSFKAYVYDSNGYGQYTLESGSGINVTSISNLTDVSLSRDSTTNGAVSTYTFTITLVNVIKNGDYIQVVFPSQIGVNSVANQWVGITNLVTSLTCSVKGQNVWITVSLLDSLTQLPEIAGDTSTQIEFTISNITNPPSLETCSTFQIYMMKSDQVNYIVQRLTGVTVTNTDAGTLTSVSASPDDSTLGATTNYLISFTPSTSIQQNTVVTVQLPSQISVDTSSTMTCTKVLVIESTLTCSYDTSTRTITVTNGFITNSSYVQSQVEFKISNLINPTDAGTTDSFVIKTMTSSSVLYDEISTGVTYTKTWNSPCEECLSDLSSCTSCYTTSSLAYLSSSTWVASWPSGEYSTSGSYVWETCVSPWNSWQDSGTYCQSCINGYYLYKNTCLSSWPSNYSVDDDGITWVKTGEFILPFIPLGLYLIMLSILGIIRCKKERTMFISWSIVLTWFFLIFLIPIETILLFRDSHYQSGLVTLVWFIILIMLNFSWTFFTYRTEIKTDILFTVWVEIFPKTEKFVHIISYIAWFQWFRISYWQFYDLARFDASIKIVETMYIKLNRFSIFYILFVLIPILLAACYNLAWTTSERQVFWHDIELLIIIVIQIVLLVFDVWTKDESALQEKYIDKEEFAKEKDFDITNKSMLSYMHHPKGDLENLKKQKTQYVGKRDDENDILRLAVYNKLANNPYSDHFTQNIKLFKDAMKPEQDEDVVSNNSFEAGNNKMKVKEMNPFKDKYEDTAINPSRNIHLNIETNSNDNDFEHHETTHNMPGESNIEISNSEYNFRPDTPESAYISKQNNETVIRKMMQTVNPHNKMPKFTVEIESNNVLNARNELKAEIEKQTELNREKMELDHHLMELHKQVKELEQQKNELDDDSNISEENSDFQNDNNESHQDESSSQ